ncbi:hypothetical protein [Leptospira brenneri]|uniref:hypothetical protein n=1 Tax=Leptospira brenneri TaxID=2023182 RepID=UPI000C2A7098|nr:hypothetical protein [Leptospira brenneri]PJZ43664.1 hypothetical protein CH361_19235 [Leptospira brenneri]
MFAFVFIAFLNPIVFVYELWNQSLVWVHDKYFAHNRNAVVGVCPLLGTLPPSEDINNALMDGHETQPERSRRIWVEDHTGRRVHYAKPFVSDAKNIDRPGELKWFLEEYKLTCGLDRPPYYEEIAYIKNARANGIELPKGLE